MVKDADLDVKALSTIKEILVNNATQQSMGEKSSRLGKLNAGKEIAQKILALSSLKL
jgi:UDP-N-acetylglucosamine:LPS N-acetylglucosamine transferase